MQSQRQIFIPQEFSPAKIVGLKVKKNETVQRHTILCTYKLSDETLLPEGAQNILRELEAPSDATIVDVHVSAGGIVTAR
jgi:hypothetical protein